MLISNVLKVPAILICMSIMISFTETCEQNNSGCEYRLSAGKFFILSFIIFKNAKNLGLFL